MSQLYTVTIAISIMTMVVMLFQIHGTDLLGTGERIGFSVTFALVIAAALAEWTGVYLNGRTEVSAALYTAIKCFEFCVTPWIPLSLCGAVGAYRAPETYGRSFRIIGCVLAGHVLLEIVSAFFGWIFYIDGSLIYCHGPLYDVYTAFYVVSILYFFITMLGLSQHFQNRNCMTLTLAVLEMFGGIVVHLIWPAIRVDWITAAVALSLFYTYYVDLLEQNDSLTGLMNRRCYDHQLKVIHYRTAFIMFDVDNFKSINDTYGHGFGDVSLQKVAQCIRSAYTRDGRCYRIGGDEFCVILRPRRIHSIPGFRRPPYDTDVREGMEFPQPTKLMNDLNNRFTHVLAEARAQDPRLPDVSLGYDFFDGTGSLEEAIHRADALMYEKKRRRKLEKAQAEAAQKK